MSAKEQFTMATYTPPPYFPQSALAPPDENRYKKFKMMIVLAAVLAVIILGGLGVAVWYLVKWVF